MKFIPAGIKDYSFYFCLSISLSVCCLFACLFICLFVCPFICRFVCLHSAYLLRLRHCVTMSV